MEIRQLEYFLMVSKVNSFTRAAERLFVSQPAVTNAIRSLEVELGIQLFDRNQKQALLTVEGEIFCRHVTQLMDGISNTLTEINALKDLNKGALRVGLTPLGGIQPVVQLMSSFKESYPNIELLLKEANTQTLIQALVAEETDIAFILKEQDKLPGTIEAVPLTEQDLFVCCSKRHRLRRHNAVTLQDIAAERFILFEKSAQYRQIIEEAFASENIRPCIAMESNHVQTIKSLVAADMGISILPESMLDYNDNLVNIALTENLSVTPLLAYKSNRQLSHAAEAFLLLVERNEK